VEALRDSMAFKGVSGLRSEVRVRVRREGKGLGTYKGSLAFESPDLLRLRVYGALGNAGLEAVHSRGLLQIYFPQERVLYEGKSPASGGGLAYNMRDSGGDYELLAYESHNGATRLRASYVFDRETLLNKEINFYDSDERYLTISFARYLGGVPMSMSVDLFGGYSADVELIDPERVDDLPDELFKPIPRGDAIVMPLELIVEQAR
jgi:hypothetical protein